MCHVISRYLVAARGDVRTGEAGRELGERARRRGDRDRREAARVVREERGAARDVGRLDLQ